MSKKTKHIVIRNVDDFENLEDQIREMINDEIDSRNETPTGYAKQVGIHPAQMLGFLRGDKGILLSTIAKVGKNS